MSSRLCLRAFVLRAKVAAPTGIGGGVREDGRKNKKRKTKKRIAGRCKGMMYRVNIHSERKAQDRDAWKIIVKRALDTNGTVMNPWNVGWMDAMTTLMRSRII